MSRFHTTSSGMDADVGNCNAARSLPEALRDEDDVVFAAALLDTTRRLAG